MIKNINPQNLLTTPFVAAKEWHLSNTDGDDLIILEDSGSEDTVALEFLDYSSGTAVLNTSCSIALEQQSTDLAQFQEGISGSGTFYPETEPTNKDGTYKRLVHSQIKTTFYNNYQNPLEIWGLENIDFPLGRTFRDISDVVRIFTIPRDIFGEKLVGKTIQLTDNSLDDNVEIVDDGNQNLIAKTNLFSKVQEVRKLGNNISSGSTTSCS